MQKEEKRQTILAITFSPGATRLDFETSGDMAPRPSLPTGLTTPESHKNIGGGEESELNSDSQCTLRLCLTKELLFSPLGLQILSAEK